VKLCPHALGLALALACGACTIGPDYERPKSVTPPPQYRSVISEQQAESFADLPWVELFDDPELQALIEAALRNNLDLLSAAARVEEFRARYGIQRSAFGPDIRVSGGTSPSPASDEDSSYSAGITLNWEIDLFGRLRRASEAARADLLASEDNARALMASLVAAVASTWFQLRELDAEAAIVADNIAGQERSLALVRSLLANGVASATEEQQALAQLATTRSQRPLVAQQILETENFLQFLTGAPPAAVERSAEQRAFPVPPDVPVGLPAQLLTRRADLRALENVLHSATAQIGVAEAERFPYLSLGLTSFFGLVSPELSNLLGNDDPTVELSSIGPFFDVPLFTSGRGTASVEAARAAVEQALLAYRAGVLTALSEVSNALGSTQHVRELIAENEVRTDAAREVLRLQQMRYRAGVVSYIEILDAERQVFAAEIDLARSQLEELLSYVELYRALGGGWSDAELQRLVETTE
jgi:multidrug efflux system outer membrane protein